MSIGRSIDNSPALMAKAIDAGAHWAAPEIGTAKELGWERKWQS